MNTPHKMHQNEIKGAKVEVRLGNNIYRICSRAEMAAILDVGKAKIIEAATAAGEKLSDEDVAKRVSAWQESCGFATTDWILSRLPPAEQERWKASYRFSGVSRGLK